MRAVSMRHPDRRAAGDRSPRCVLQLYRVGENWLDAALETRAGDAVRPRAWRRRARHRRRDRRHRGDDPTPLEANTYLALKTANSGSNNAPAWFARRINSAR